MMNPSKASSSSLVVALVMAIFLSSMLTLNAFSIQSAHHTFSSSRSFRPPLVIRDKQSLLFLSNNKSNNNIEDISAFSSNKEKEKNGLLMGLGSVVTSTVAALLLFLSVDEAAMTAYSTNNSDILNANGLTSNVVANAAAEKVPQKNIPAPPITASSSAEAMQIGQDLQSLDAKMFGAYWCSHCYDQKQRLGKEVFTNYVPYIECSKEGLNNQRELCEEKKIPGYPTWEIGGKLYPGEMYLDELTKIIQDARK
jgi:hypothetical protein